MKELECSSWWQELCLLRSEMRRLRVFVLVCVVGLVVASCGGGGASETTVAGGGSETTVDSGSGSTVAGGGGSELPTRDEILAGAKEESGELIVGGSFEDSQIEALAAAFKEAYPFTDPVFIDVSSSESPTILLELGAGTHETDLIKIEEGTAMPEYVSFMEDVDLVGLIESGAFENLKPQMVAPVSGKLFAYATYLGVTSWNTDRMAELGIDMDAVETWDDLIEMCDSLPAGQLVMDVNAEMEASLNIAMGEEWATQFAQDLLDHCQPTFSRGGSGRIAGLASGEYAINLVGNNHHALRVAAEGAPIALKFLTPITGKTSGITGIRAGTDNYYQSLLMTDFLASHEAQQIMDELNPAGSFQDNGDPLPQNEGFVNTEAVVGQETSIMDWEHFDEYPGWIETMLGIWGYPTGD
jgi:Bacterial extracellular solute-binding protein